MTTEFKARNFTAKYDESSEMWNVYNRHLLFAKIYDDSASICFLDADTSVDLSDLNDISMLIKEAARQYRMLNQ